jgi:type IV pilus assembly protein PilW
MKPWLQPSLRQSRGLGLAELMVAMAVASVLALLAAALLSTANASYLTQTQGAQLDDSGRYALAAIASALRHAALRSWDGSGAPLDPHTASPAALSGLDARSVSREGDGIELATPDVANGSDVLAVRFSGAGPAPDGDGSVSNCAGFGVPASSDAGWSIFYVGRSADGEAELRCKYRGHSGWAADAIVRGVDSFQVLYGLDTDEPQDGLANRFVTASTLNALDAALVLDAVDPAARASERRRRTVWKRVTTVTVSLLLHGDAGAHAGHRPAQFDLFGKAYGDGFSHTDRGTRISEAQMPAELGSRERQLFSASFALRNPAL